jgi:glucan phosphoethanolaminetransferase (alkaline phosphatase superfamily)
MGNMRGLGCCSTYWLFLPVGFMTCVISGLIGGTPPTDNVLAERFQLTADEFLGTKSVYFLVLKVSKGVVYLLCIWLHQDMLRHMAQTTASLGQLLLLTAIAAVAASLAISLGKGVLARIKASVFHSAVNRVILLTGLFFFASFMRHF